jgi:hypothetical protein
MHTKKTKFLFFAAILVFCAGLIFLMPNDMIIDTVSAHHSLRSTAPLFLSVSGGAVTNLTWVMFKLFVLVLTVLGAFLIVNRKRKPLLAILLCAIFSINAFDNILTYQLIQYSRSIYFLYTEANSDTTSSFSAEMKKSYSDESFSYNDSLIESLILLNSYVQGLDGTVSVFRGYDSVGSATIGAIPHGHYLVGYKDTYLSPKLFPLDPQDLTYLPDESNRRAAAFVLPVDDSGTMQHFDYIIVSEDFIPFTNVDIVYVQPPFVVLRNLEPDRIYLRQ